MVSKEKAQISSAQERLVVPEDDLDDLPPAYTLPSPSPSRPERTVALGRTVPGLPNVAFASYVPTGAHVSRDTVTISITDSALTKSPQAMAKFITEQIALPPMPEMRIVGTHKEWRQDKLDFDIRINMMRYFVPQNGSAGLSYSTLISGGGKKRTTPEGSAAAIQQWAQAFCDESAIEKSFTITRKLSNWDTEALIGRVLALVQAINYKGTTDITFPVSHQRITLRGSQSFGTALRSAFIGSGKFEVEVAWPYASRMPGEDSDSEPPGSRSCLVRSEVGWFRDWKPVLRAAMLDKKRGWIGLDDWMETAMKPRASDRQPAPWGVSQ